MTAKLLRWGLVPSWANDPSIGVKLINARAETLAEKPSFRQAYQRRRCLIPADGFYAWQTVDRQKQPYYFYLRDRPVEIVEIVVAPVVLSGEDVLPGFAPDLAALGIA